MVKLFYDVETTGLKDTMHSIHQLAGIIEVNDRIVERFNIKMAPHPKAAIDPIALTKAGVTEKQIRAYPHFVDGYKEFKSLLEVYVDRFNPDSKIYRVGFNNRAFDDGFLYKLFDLAGNRFFFAYFWPDAIDAMCLASEYLLDRRTLMPSFKLKRVAIELGIEVDKSELHDAVYDAELTRKIYRITTGRELEL